MENEVAETLLQMLSTELSLRFYVGVAFVSIVMAVAISFWKEIDLETFWLAAFGMVVTVVLLFNVASLLGVKPSDEWINFLISLPLSALLLRVYVWLLKKRE